MKSTVEQLDQAAVLVPWLTRARRAIDDRLRDAMAQGSAGVRGAADERLTELATSLRSMLETARAEFYTKAFTTQLAVLDRSLLIPGIGPTQEGEYAARLAPIKGVDQASMISASVEKARRELGLAMASSYGRTGELLVFVQWEKRHNRSINSTTSMALGTSQVALFHAVGQLMIRPEIR